jgi:hypothetical protein
VRNRPAASAGASWSGFNREPRYLAKAIRFRRVLKLEISRRRTPEWHRANAKKEYLSSQTVYVLKPLNLALPLLSMVFGVAGFGPFRQRNRLLLLCGSDRFAERSANLGFASTNCCEKHSAEPIHFGTPPAPFSPCGQCFRFPYCLKSFASTIREVQSFSL